MCPGTYQIGREILNRPVRIGSRSSALAVAQSRLAAEQLVAANPGLETEWIGYVTKGDVMLDTRLDLIGGKGLFVTEIEHALLQGEIDIAVHSMKDMPATMPQELCIGAVLVREDPRDVLVTTDGRPLAELRESAVVGTSSVRRELQLRRLRPDLQIRPLRGNVTTRLEKLDRGEYDAIVLAAAGLLRLGLPERCVQPFPFDQMLPAVGQGILGIQIRRDSVLRGMLQRIHRLDAALALEAERAFMVNLKGSCSTPMAAHAEISGDHMRLSGMLFTAENPAGYGACVEGDSMMAGDLGAELAGIILDMSRV